MGEGDDYLVEEVVAYFLVVEGVVAYFLAVEVEDDFLLEGEEGDFQLVGEEVDFHLVEVGAYFLVEEVAADFLAEDFQFESFLVDCVDLELDRVVVVAEDHCFLVEVGVEVVLQVASFQSFEVACWLVGAYPKVEPCCFHCCCCCLLELSVVVVEEAALN